ncbi:MAG: ATP-dependent RNA helicase HrpA, partial [Frankia sp.]
MTSPLADLQSRLPALTVRDEHRLRRRLDTARKARDGDRREEVLAAIAAEVDTAERRLAERRAAVPTITYPEILPVSARRDEIAAAIRDHQVVVVAGETGSGKTTQLPKICLELGRGIRGFIGHTQPRRLAARTVADRIAEELDTSLGAAVGYKIRFTDSVGDSSLIKIMTDGILLAEIAHDRLLRQYDTLIIDEAHERSLNIDFILGYLREILPRRPDLKVVITSATIDPERFSRHFAARDGGGAPIIEVSGRTFPVEVRYRPIIDPDDPRADLDRDQVTAITDAVDELSHEGPGDILVFLSGEREIRDTTEALTKRGLADTEVLPLFARLSMAEQRRVFAPHRGRRVVLATNVAETSLTVPGIRYVIDPGTARISRYNHRTKIQRLPIEPVSQASANQRAGRCGRTSDGICIRLYTEDDYLGRPRFTDPEILRTNLASVILAMTSLGLGDLAAFPFVDPPDRRSINDGVTLLHELNALEVEPPPGRPGAAPAQAGPAAADTAPGEAVQSAEPAPPVAVATGRPPNRRRDQGRRLTPTGRILAQLPVDPRFARMIVEADRNGCLDEVMVIAAGLSIQDPRERPSDARGAADAKHARFIDPRSDFLAYLKLWQYLAEAQRELSSSAFRRLCRTEFLNYLRIREWQDVHGQLRQITRGLGMTPNATPAPEDRVHMALLAGLLSHLGVKDPEKGDYQGARGGRFSVFPGSALFRKPPRWVMAAEMVETSRPWGRVVARVEPEWVESLAGHLVMRTYSEPHWNGERGAVMALEKVTLFGLPIVPARRITYGAIDPVLCRDLFIRHALVEGDWQTHHRFFHDNRKLRERVEDLEHRARRRDIVVDDETLFAFYDARVGAEVVSARHFDSWWKKTRATQPDLLSFSTDMLVNTAAARVAAEDYPDVWRADGLELKLSYQFEPGTAADGVTVAVPLAVLNRARADGFDWQVPGLREDLVTALIKSLPKGIRRSFVPAPDYARAALAEAVPYSGPLLDALERELRRLSGITVTRGDWDLARVPDHLKVTFRVLGEKGRTLAEGKDLDALKRSLGATVAATISAAAQPAGIERRGLTTWDFGELPRVFERGRAGQAVRGYPALVDDGATVAVRLFGSEGEQRRAMWTGTRRLILLQVPSPVKLILRYLSPNAKLALSRNPYRDVTDLFEDCVAAAADGLMAEAGGPAWDSDGFATLRNHVRAGLADRAQDVVEQVGRVLTVAHDVEMRLRTVPTPALLPSFTDMRGQLAGLVYRGFVSDAGAGRIGDVERYLRGLARRLEKVSSDAAR